MGKKKEGSYKVSALRYRPRVFSEVVGQSHVTETLARAVEQGQIPQAMLFCGPRGVGKTSCARIVARMANGWNNDDDTAHLDIFELDAASNNSVEDIRTLTAQVRFPPQKGKYKVYVIDEVHMLSKQAFNAFLKTLEEPPDYVLFILATTEKNRVLPTILSRCQIFDFKPLSLAAIQSYLNERAEEDHIQSDESVLLAIAKKANGSMRDALSLYDVLRTYAGDAGLTQAGIKAHWYLLDDTYFSDLTEKLHKSDLSAALVKLDEALKAGVDLHYFLVEWSDYIRLMLLASDAQTLTLAAPSAGLREQYGQTAQGFGRPFLLRALRRLNEALLQHHTRLNPRLGLEMVLIELSEQKSTPSAPSPPAQTSSPEAEKTSTTTSTASSSSSAPPKPLIPQPPKTPRISIEDKDHSLTASSPAPSKVPDEAPPPSQKTRSSSPSAYTDSERFERLKREYPILQSLETQFDLRPRF